MKQKDIAALPDEPACSHNNKSKSGCARPKPGSTAGGCAFDGAQIALARQLTLAVGSPVWAAVRTPAPWAVNAKSISDRSPHPGRLPEGEGDSAATPAQMLEPAHG